MIRLASLAIAVSVVARCQTPSMDLTRIAGDPSTARLIAVVVRDRAAATPGPAPSPYEATLEFACNSRFDDPAVESKRLAVALAALPRTGAQIHLWAEGLAGLLARKAVEELDSSAPIHALILVDVPNRGLSPSGWPEWEGGGGTPVPPWAVSGSRFLRDLNAKRQQELEILTFNLWRRGGRTAPRASVLQLPRGSIAAVVDSPAGPFWQILDGAVNAVRRLGPGGPGLRTSTGDLGKDAKLRAPRPSTVSRPRVSEFLRPGFRLPDGVDVHWIEFAAKPAAPSDPLQRLTDIIGVRYFPARRSVAIAGFEDYFREPLRSDLLFAAIRAYRRNLPAISIDPRRPADPPNQAPVRYEGGLAGTRLGGLMFEADRVMKALSLGRDNIARTQVASSVNSYEAIAGARPRDYRSQETMWRLWFEPSRWHALEPDPLSAVFDARFRVNWQQMTEGYAPSEPVVKFTESLTRDFEQYAQEQPSLDQLDQSARLMALASWIVEGKLDIRDSAASPRLVSTPAHTPLIEVSSSGTFDRYQVTQILQGGAVAAPALRHVREPAGDHDALFKSILALYPALEPRPPPAAQAPPRPGSRRVIPNVAARPPTLTAGFLLDDVVHQAAFFPASPLQTPPGIAIARDSKDSPPKTVDDIIRARALAPQLDRISVDDSEDPPVMTFRGNKFGSTRGEILFDGETLPVIRWSDTLAIASAPRPLRAGRVVLRSGNGESNPFDLSIVAGAPKTRPPSLTIENRTDFTIEVLIEAEIFGSSRQFSLAPGAVHPTRLMPGRYRISADPSGAHAILSGQNEWKTFDPQYEYRLIYESKMFAASQVTIHNRTGRQVTVSIAGKIDRTFDLAPGSTTLQVSAGSYRVTVKAWCGTSAGDVVVKSSSVQELSYACHSR